MKTHEKYGKDYFKLNRPKTLTQLPHLPMLGCSTKKLENLGEIPKEGRWGTPFPTHCFLTMASLGQPKNIKKKGRGALRVYSMKRKPDFRETSVCQRMSRLMGRVWCGQRRSPHPPHPPTHPPTHQLNQSPSHPPLLPPTHPHPCCTPYCVCP